MPRYKLPPRWKPGESGNPKGRPKGIGFRTYLKQVCEEESTDGKTNLHKVAERVVADAKKGKPYAVAVVADRIDGKVPHKIEIEGGSKTGMTPQELAEKLLNEGKQTPEPPPAGAGDGK